MKGAEKPREMRGAEHDGGLCPLAPANAGGMSRTNQAGLPRRDVKRCSSCRNEAGQFQCVFVGNRNETAPDKEEGGSHFGTAGLAGQDHSRAGSQSVQASPELSRASSIGQRLLRRPRGYSWSLAKEEVTNPPGFSSTSGTEMPDLGRSSRRELCHPLQRETQAKPQPVGGGVRKAKRNEIGKAPEESS